MTDPTTPDRPTSAGMYDFFLGGDSHTAVDEAAAVAFARSIPAIADGAMANRGFLQRAVRRMATQWGIRQFIDIGSGLPTQRNTHDVIAETVGQGRVVYVDIDPMAVARSQEILTGVDWASAIQGDVRQPGAILGHPETQRLIDLNAPVGLLLVAVLHFVPDDDDPWGLVARYLEALPPGSYLALTHGAIADQITDEALREAAKIYAATATPPTDRSRTEIERFFDGLEFVTPYEGGDPGLAYIGLWGAEDPAAADSEGARLGYAGVARKP
jgi:hypothetical protein